MKPVLNSIDCKWSKCSGHSVLIQLLVMNGCMVQVFFPYIRGFPDLLTMNQKKV